MRLLRHRRYAAVWALLDLFCWVVSLYLATWLRLDFDLSQTLNLGTIAFALAAGALHIGIGALVGPYAIGHPRGSFEEVAQIGRAALITTCVAFAVTMAITPHPVPRTAPISGGAVALALMLAIRLGVRTWRTRRPSERDERRRVIVFGAGEGGRQLVRTMLHTPESGFVPVAILDDDPRKARLHIDGVRVRGTRRSLPDVATTFHADTLVIALPSADAALMRDLRDLADEAGLEMLVLPPISEILGGRPTTTDLRDVDLNDLLGRRPITIDSEAVSTQLDGKVVLVTGAGGSIGSELARQIARFRPRKLILLDRDESGLQATKLSLGGSGLLDSDDIVLADIRELDTLRAVFRRERPEIVYHAAALKHLPLLERFPLEAYKTNVLGTLNMLTVSAETGVTAFVNISTDKAADATCALGYSKRVTERLTAGFAANHRGQYVSVRFGNVLGSRGSVIHAFTTQIERGGPLTVTHPDVERYFMLIPEACQLVLVAAAIGPDGEVLVLDMGEQVKIVDVASTLIRLSGRSDIDMVFTGLRPGEKLSENLFSALEDPHRTANPLVSSVRAPGLRADEVPRLDAASHWTAAEWMRDEAGVTYAPQATPVAS